METFWAPTSIRNGGLRPCSNQVKFEKRCVRRVLRAFGLTECEKDLISDYKMWYNWAWLTFEAFYCQFQTFPIMLSAQSFFQATTKNPRMKLSALMFNFEGTFIWRRYCEVQNRYWAICNRKGVMPGDPLPPWLHDLPVGMVFNYDGVPGGLILHNGEPLSSGLCMRFDSKLQMSMLEPSIPIRCWIEPFPHWLVALTKRGWTPKSRPNPIPVESAPQLPGSEKTIPLRPWAVRALGAGPAAIILSWLDHVLQADPAINPKATAFSSRHKGNPCVAATHADIMHVLRLSEKQVRSAIAHLRKDGYVNTARGRTVHGSKTMFILNEDRYFRARLNDLEAIIGEDWPAELEEFRYPDRVTNPLIVSAMMEAFSFGARAKPR